ncbi:uncharacterized protein LOC143578485 [Bidens hawaiensis]|uniref:uncharacterized protein LOC143578485 n=1 Tax=Bidens hawaiensis TaxID=980011 RepID=UPI00404ACAB9
MLKVSSWKGIIHCRKRGKLNLRYFGTFKIIDHVGEVAHRLDLPEELEGIHATFHISRLRKCLVDDTSHVPLVEIRVDEQLNYIEQPIEIVDRKEKKFHHKAILLVKITWNDRKGSDATWEVEKEMRKFYSGLFRKELAFGYETSFKEDFHR